MSDARTLLVILAAACAVACGRGSKRPAEGTDGGAARIDAGPPVKDYPKTRIVPPSVTLPPPEPVVLPKLVRFELLDAGKAPRRALRYDVRAVAGTDVTIASNITARSLTAGVWSEPIGVPELRYGVGITPGAVDADGTHATLLLRGLPAAIGGAAGGQPLAPAAQARADEYLTRYRAFVEGRRATSTIDARGLLGGVTIDGVSPAPLITIAELQQIWITSGVPVPTEAIGVGARWRVTTNLRRGAAVVTQTGEYQLVAVEAAPAERWKVAVDVKHIGEPQIIQLGEAADSPIADLAGLFFQARGEVTVDPRTPLPSAGTMSVELRVHLRMKHKDRTEDLIDESMGTVSITATPTGN